MLRCLDCLVGWRLLAVSARSVDSKHEQQNVIEDLKLSYFLNLIYGMT